MMINWQKSLNATYTCTYTFLMPYSISYIYSVIYIHTFMLIIGVYYTIKTRRMWVYSCVTTLYYQKRNVNKAPFCLTVPLKKDPPSHSNNFTYVLSLIGCLFPCFFGMQGQVFSQIEWIILWTQYNGECFGLVFKFETRKQISTFSV